MYLPSPKDRNFCGQTKEHLWGWIPLLQPFKTFTELEYNRGRKQVYKAKTTFLTLGSSMMLQGVRAAPSKAVISFWEHLDPPSWSQKPYKPSSISPNVKGSSWTPALTDIKHRGDKMQLVFHDRHLHLRHFQTATFRSRIQAPGPRESCTNLPKDWKTPVFKTLVSTEDVTTVILSPAASGNQVCNCSSGEFTALQVSTGNSWHYHSLGYHQQLKSSCRIYFTDIWVCNQYFSCPMQNCPFHSKTQKWLFLLPHFKAKYLFNIANIHSQKMSLAPTRSVQCFLFPKHCY